MLQNQHESESDLQKTMISKHTNEIKKPDAYGTTFESDLQKSMISKHTNEIKKPDAYGTTFESDLQKTMISKHTNEIKKPDAYGTTFESDLQKTMISKHTNEIKKPDAHGTTFQFFSLEQFLVKPEEFITIDTRIKVQLLDKVIVLSFPLLTIKTIKLLAYKLNNLRGKAKTVFHFLNKSFDKTFIYRKNDTPGILILFNTRPDETSEVRFKMSSTKKR